jgi:hypothetical protein
MEDSEFKEILARELKWSWDGAKDRETLIIRRMLYDDPIQVFKDYDLFDKINRNFWKFILKITDEEIGKVARENPHLAFRFWDV